MSTGKTYTISFAGDTSLGEWYLRKPGKEHLVDRLENDPLSYFAGVKPLVEKSDYFILNLETVLEDRPKPVLEGKEYPNYDNPDRMLKVLKELEVSAVSLANNHTMDFGEKVFLKTLKRLKKAKIETFGAGKNKEEASKPFKITLEGEKSTKNIYVFTGMRAGKRYREYGFFADKKDPGVNSLPQKGLTRQISKLRQEDHESIIIVYPHWQGRDYKWASEHKRIQERCRAFIDAGANYIFGHGTHMLNDIEHYNGGTIAYSIGNFIFNSPGRYKKMQAPPYSLIVNMEVQEDNDGTWHVKNKFYPIMTDNKATDFNVKPFENEKSPYIELKNRGKNHYKKYNPLNELGIKTKSNKPMKRVKRFSNHQLLAKEFEVHNIKTKSIGEYLVADINNKQIYFYGTRPSTDSYIGTAFAKNKSLAKIPLEENGLSVTKGSVFSRKNQKEALKYAENFKSSVVKPLAGNKGRGVTVGITNKEEFLAAWNEALKVSKGDILVEEEFTDGNELRYLVIGGKYIAAYSKVPPKITGNGIDAIEDLIQKKNEQRAMNPHLTNLLIHMNEPRQLFIEKQGYQLRDVLEKGKEILIDTKASISTGGESVDMTDDVHDSFKEIAEKSAAAIPGIDVVGLDILAKDHSKPASEDSYIIVEVNTKPGLGGHQYPFHGKQRNIAKVIVDYIINKVEKNHLFDD